LLLFRLSLLGKLCIELVHELGVSDEERDGSLEDIETPADFVGQVEVLVRSAQPGPYEALDRALYRTAAMTGVRDGELIALRWHDVDWSASAIRVRSNYVLNEFGTPKSKRSSRAVPMADQVAGELERYYKACGEPDEQLLVFPDRARVVR